MALTDSLRTRVQRRLSQVTRAMSGSKSSGPFVGAIDQGTTSSRFLIFNTQGEVLASHQIEFKQYYPQSGWHEHDPEEIISSVETCIDGAVKDFESQGYSAKDIKCVGITNQRETTVLWDVETGKALYNGIVWTDTRTQNLIRKLKDQSGSDELPEKCGLPLSTYPSVGKVLWLLENEKSVKEAYEAGRLAFGTVDAWLVYKLNGGKSANVFVSDVTNSSRTMFMNIHTLKYDDSLISWFGLDSKKLHMPKIIRSSDPEQYGKLASTVLKGLPITGVLGDQSAALVGQKGFHPGLAKNTYGTGCFLLYNVGEKPVISKHGLLSTVAYDFGSEPVMYALEGSIAVAGSSVIFLRDNLELIKKSSGISALAETVEDNGGVTFVTAFSGLFAPYWMDDARGTICKCLLVQFRTLYATRTVAANLFAPLIIVGITAYTQRGHIARATLEATCFQTKAILEAMEKDSGAKLAHLAVDGGMCNSELTMQVRPGRLLTSKLQNLLLYYL